MISFPRCPPRTFLPALSQIFLDETAQTSTLEAAMRAVTFYLDVSGDCVRKVVQVEGAVAAICNLIEASDVSRQDTKDLAMQSVKVS